MRLTVCSHRPAFLAVLLACQIAPGLGAASGTIPPSPTLSDLSTPPSTSLGSTCEARTVNYITHRLPQQCLKSAWTDNSSSSPDAGASQGTASESASDAATVLVATTGNASESPSTPTDLPGSDSTLPSSSSITATISSPIEHSQATEPTGPAANSEEEDLDEAAFLSFEDWKKQNLERTEQAAGSQRASKSEEDDYRDIERLEQAVEESNKRNKAADPEPSASKADQAKRPSGTQTGINNQHDVEEAREKKEHARRSKDAGKTCKERFSYSSFDAGATVLKTNPEAKNSKALLVENKDSYMLTPCSASNKFVIVELSDDILVDTVVLANFEFFSSMFRQFRVSVSDRYPVKLDRWKYLGTFEARNTREIQAFLVENPLIWARYLRVEFLSHYGNEFYCPVSILRVHGKSQLEDYRQQEEAASGEADNDDDSDEGEADIGEKMIPEAVAVNIGDSQSESTEAAESTPPVDEVPMDSSHSSTEPMGVSGHNQTSSEAEADLSTENFSPWLQASDSVPLYFQDLGNLGVCSLSEDPGPTQIPNAEPPKNSTHTSTGMPVSAEQVLNNTSSSVVQVAHSETSSQSYSSTALEQSATATSGETVQHASHLPDDISISTKASDSTATTSKVSSTTSVASPSPTTQESFFKTVSRRLQLLETNSTLSLKYIEDQSRILREAFNKVEKKHLAKTTSFLEQLNSTVLNELRELRLQYDQIWQSTVIELESQREQSQREVLAVSARLNILANEVVFQKRMSIVQSILLLLCLGLVIFSRGATGSFNDLPIIQSMLARSRNATGLSLDTPVDGSSVRRVKSVPDDLAFWDSSEPTAQQTRETSEEAPITPFSTYSRSEAEASEEGGRREKAQSGSQSRLRSLSPFGSSEPYEDEGLDEPTARTSDAFLRPPDSATWGSHNRRNPQLNSATWASDSRFESSGRRLSAGDMEPTSPDSEFEHSDGRASLEMGEEGQREDGLQHLPSPPPEVSRQSSVARKPLPALPQQAS